MLALDSGHTVSNVTTPDLVGLLYCKLTIQVIRDIRPFNGGLLVSVRAWLLTDEAQFAHKTSNLEATNDNAFLAEQSWDDDNWCGRSCFDDNDSGRGIRSSGDSDSDSEFSESNFDDSFDDSINPANGLPMVGSFDIECNVYGTNSIDDDLSMDHATSIDDGFGIDHSGSIFDDDLGFSDDSWL